MKEMDCKEIYSDPRHYDLKYRDLVEDIPFWLRQIEKYGEPVLELACGTGRLTIPIAEKGVDITGLDIFESMLALARKKAKEKKVNVQWIKADCRDFKLNKKFKLIFLPFSSIGHFQDIESINACFSRVKEHLTDEGRFIIDYFNPKLEFLLREPEKRHPVTEYPDPDGKKMVVITETSIYDKAKQINRIKWFYKIENETEEIVKELNIRIYYPQELDALLYFNGFNIEAKYGNYDETSFDSDSPNQLVICHIRK